MIPLERDSLIVMILGVVSCAAAILVLGFGLIVGSSIEPDSAIVATATVSLQTPLPVRPMLPTFTPSGPIVIPPGVTEQPDAPSITLSPEPGANPAASSTPSPPLAVTPTQPGAPTASPSPTREGGPPPVLTAPPGLASPTLIVLPPTPQPTIPSGNGYPPPILLDTPTPQGYP